MGAREAQAPILRGDYRARRIAAAGRRTPVPAAISAAPAASTSASDSPVNGSCPPESAAASGRVPAPDDCVWLAPSTPLIAPDPCCDEGCSVAEVPATPDEPPPAAPPPDGA